MAISHSRLASGTALSLVMSCALLAGPAWSQAVTEDIQPIATEASDVIVLDTVVITAEEQAKQALGTSSISAEDLEKQPVVNDISEVVRRMPGVNLTGNAGSGQYGNNRQIDIRGMGPENTLILIDGKPVLSRNSAKMGRAGERDTRGDSNWVAPELIERIDVLRGPAAARYGSGASGGVVNIITKRPDTFTGSVGLSYHKPESSMEGDNIRTNFLLAGPAGEHLTFRLTGNFNKQNGDSPELNDDAANIETAPAGREGVTNKDIGSILSWNIAEGHEVDFEFNFSRQANVYVGERGTGGSGEPGSVTDDLAQERATTSRIYRRTLGLTHRGEYDFGESVSYLQWENTRNASICRGTGGAGEGSPTFCEDSDGDGTNDTYRFDTVTLDNIIGKSEWILPMTIAGRNQTMTLGAEIRHERMSDPTTNLLPSPEGDPTDSPSKTDQTNLGLYAESNIEWNDQLTLTPALRLDWADTYGFNASPSLNATYAFNDEWQMKMGVARAFKSPNLFQLNPNYRYTSRGNGCMRVDDEDTRPPYGGSAGENTCYIYGNPDLKPETSINAEIGLAYDGLNGIAGSFTFFHNDYKNRIAAGDTLIGYDPIDGRRMFIWDNTPKAVVQGLEGNFSTPLGENFALNVNATYMLKSENKETGQPLSLVPKHTINASVDWFATPNLTFTLAATNYGRIKPLTVNTSTSVPYDRVVERPGYTLFNLSSRWQINDNAVLSAGVSNLFNKEIYRTHISWDPDTGESISDANTFNEPGRSFYLSLQQSF